MNAQTHAFTDGHEAAVRGAGCERAATPLTFHDREQIVAVPSSRARGEDHLLHADRASLHSTQRQPSGPSKHRFSGGDHETIYPRTPL